MRIRLTTGITGLDSETRAFSHEPGDIIDVPDAQAVEWLEREMAEPVDPAPQHRRRETRVQAIREVRS